MDTGRVLARTLFVNMLRHCGYVIPWSGFGGLITIAGVYNIYKFRYVSNTGSGTYYMYASVLIAYGDNTCTCLVAIQICVATVSVNIRSDNVDTSILWAVWGF
jgi:hypothetical protein